MFSGLIVCGGISKADAADTEKTKLVFMHGFAQEAVNDFFNKAIAEFEEKMPGYTIENRYVPFDDINKQMSIAIAAGEIPDIVSLNNPDVASYVEMGGFADINSMVEEWEDYDQFYDLALEAGKVDGKQYGLPYDTNCLALFYNKDMLEEKNVDVPTTLEELREAAKQLTDSSKGIYGMAISGKDSEETTYQFMSFLSAFGGTYDQIDSQEAQNAVQLYVDLVQDGSMSPEIITMGQGDIRDRFVAGQVAMMINGTWEVGQMKDGKTYPDMDFNWDVALIPAGPEGSYSCLGGKILGCGNTENVEASFEFVKIICSKEKMLTFAKEVGAVPNRKDVAEDPYWTEDPQIAVFVKQQETAVPRGPHAQWPEISLDIRTGLIEAINGDKTVEQAMTDAQAKIDKVK